jgi:hypothetical protein
MDAERQMYETTLRQLRALLEAQERLRRAAERMAREAREELERVAEALCPEEVDRLRVRSPQGLAALSPRQIAELVIQRAAHRPTSPALVQGGTEVRVADLEARLRAALDRAARAEAEVAALRAKSLAAVQEDHRQGLVQRAADLLVAAGYAVERIPAPIPLPDGAAFQPDLMICEEDRRLPVEVEDLSRPPEEREARWEACYHLTGGDLRFVAPDPETLDRVRSEVFYWLGPRPFSLRMTDLSYGKGRYGEAVWRIRRGIE